MCKEWMEKNLDNILVGVLILSFIGSLVFGLVFSIDGLLNIAGIILAGFLGAFTVNRYQEKKDERLTRESLIDDLTKVDKTFHYVRYSWNQWSSSLLLEKDEQEPDESEIPGIIIDIKTSLVTSHLSQSKLF